MESHYQSLIKNRLTIQTVTKSSKIVLKIEMRISNAAYGIDFTGNNVNASVTALKIKFSIKHFFFFCTV